MKYEFLTPQVIHYTYPSQYHVCSAFLRIQEFYESPEPQFRGQFFTMDEYMDWYADTQRGHDKFTYFEDWVGFNIPSTAMKAFYDRYTPTCMRPKEHAIFKPLLPLIEDGKKFYVIATEEDGNEVEITVRHELRHAAYYLNEEYRAACGEIYKTIPDELKEAVNTRLKEYGYGAAVFPDETQAFFSTEKPAALRKRFRTELPVTDYAKAYASLKID